jgi:hypothetical protein
MPNADYCVFVVVDGEFGSRLSELVQGGPVWIIDSPANRTAAQKIWTEHPEYSELDGVTVFRPVEGYSREDALIYELGTIDLHHGAHAANPPYTVIEVLGTPVSERIKTELSQFGFNEFRGTAAGFRAVRPMPGIG